VGWIIAIAGHLGIRGDESDAQATAHERQPPRSCAGGAGGRVLLLAAPVIRAVAVLNSDRGVPLAGLILVGFVLAFQYVTTPTRFGRHIFAVAARRGPRDGPASRS